MKLHMPVQVYFEKNAVTNHSAELAALGRKALIVTGKHSSRMNGSLSDVQKALTKHGCDWVAFDDIEENPSVETIQKAAQFAVEAGADFVVGVGGGSPMDAAKAVSVLAANPGLISRAQTVLYSKDKLHHLPVAEIPTTSGTGSEVTQYAILTLHDSNTKMGIFQHVFAELAFVDPGYLATSSYRGMVSTCVDALAHLIESYLNTNATVFSRAYALDGMRIWGSVKDRLLSETAYAELTDDDRESFMLASVYGGISIAHTGTSIPHGLSYPITYEMGVAHGKAVGIFLPAYLRVYEDRTAVQTVLDTLGFEDERAFSAYIKTILGDVAVSGKLWKEDVQKLACNPAKLKNYPFQMDEVLLGEFRP